MTRAAVALVLVAGAYALMLASSDPVDLATGVAVAAVVLVGFRGFLFAGRPAPGPGLLTRLAAFPAFAAAVVRDIVRGTWEVALIVLHVRPLRAPGIVTIPVGGRTPTGLVVSAFVATLSPGEFLVELDHEGGFMLLHVIDASDPDKVRREHQEFYERFQRRVFP